MLWFPPACLGLWRLGWCSTVVLSLCAIICQMWLRYSLPGSWFLSAEPPGALSIAVYLPWGGWEGLPLSCEIIFCWPWWSQTLKYTWGRQGNGSVETERRGWLVNVGMGTKRGHILLPYVLVALNTNFMMSRRKRGEKKRQLASDLISY